MFVSAEGSAHRKKEKTIQSHAGKSLDPSYVPPTKGPDFTEGEIKLFERRYENGYDLEGDDRYNYWLKCYHPEANAPGLYFREHDCLYM